MSGTSSGEWYDYVNHILIYATLQKYHAFVATRSRRGSNETARW